MILADLRCSCGSPDVLLIAPGSAPQQAPGGFVYDRGEPIRATCLACWRPLPAYQQTLFVEYPA